MTATKGLLQILLTVLLFKQIHSSEDGYLRYVKDSCFIRGEALSCVKYKALKIAKKAIFGDNFNETIKANQMISFVPLDEETIQKLSDNDKVELQSSEPKGFMSEWAELAKYLMKLMKNFFRVKGLRVNLPEGARTVEDDADVDVGDVVNDNAPGTNKTFSAYKGRGKKKKLAIVIPFLTLLTAIKTKLLLIPVLLSVLLLKKLLLIGALLLPSLLNTLKACKHHHPHASYSYFGASDSSDFNADYGNTYAYSAGTGYNKDWASNRAYGMQKHSRPTPAPAYFTAPGVIA